MLRDAVRRHFEARRSRIVVSNGMIVVAGMVLLSLASAACADVGRGRPITIANGASEAVSVAYHVTDKVGKDDIVEAFVLQPGATTQYMRPFNDGSQCGLGTLVASIEGREIARLSRPCQDARWAILSAPPTPRPT